MEIPQEDTSGEILSKTKRVRGKTRCVKLHKYVVDYDVKHMIELHDMGNFKGNFFLVVWFEKRLGIHN